MSIESLPPHQRNTPHLPDTSPNNVFPSNLQRLLPSLEPLEPENEQIAHVKLIAPEIPSWALYVAAFDGEDTVFGLWTSFYEVHTGYFSVAELENAYRTLGITVGQDTSFEPLPLHSLQQRHEAALKGRRFGQIAS